MWKQMRHRVYRNLDEIYAGTYDGMTEAQIASADERFGEDRRCSHTENDQSSAQDHIAQSSTILP